MGKEGQCVREAHSFFPPHSYKNNGKTRTRQNQVGHERAQVRGILSWPCRSGTGAHGGSRGSSTGSTGLCWTHSALLLLFPFSLSQSHIPDLPARSFSTYPQKLQLRRMEKGASSSGKDLGSSPFLCNHDSIKILYKIIFYISIVIDKTMVYFIPYIKTVIYLVNIFSMWRDKVNSVSSVRLYWGRNSIQRLFLKMSKFPKTAMYRTVSHGNTSWALGSCRIRAAGL